MPSRCSSTVSMSDSWSGSRGFDPTSHQIFFSRFWQFHRKWLHQSAKYDQIPARQVRISRKRHLTCLNFCFGFCGNFGLKTRKIVRAVPNKTGSYQPISLIFNSKHGVSLGYIVSKFEANRTKIATMRVPHTKSAKWPPWRHRIEISKIWEK